jgi:hypothetical protein
MLIAKLKKRIKMTKTVKHSGSSHSVAGMAVTAHKLGLKSRINFSEFVGSPIVPLYGIVIDVFPAPDWELDPTQPENRLHNRKAVRTAVSISLAAKIGLALTPANEGCDLFDEVVNDMEASATKVCREYSEWWQHEDCSATDLHNHLYGVLELEEFDEIFINSTKDFANEILSAGGELNEVDVLEAINLDYDFGAALYSNTNLFPAWRK